MPDKLDYVVVDDGPYMLDTPHIAGGMYRLQLHTYLVFIVVFVDLFSIFVPFYYVSHIGSMLVANQASTNKTFSNVVNIIPLALGVFAFSLAMSSCEISSNRTWAEHASALPVLIHAR